MTPPRVPACPACGANMVQRQNARGQFLGCTNFPRCRRTVALGRGGVPAEPVRDKLPRDTAPPPPDEMDVVLTVRAVGDGPPQEVRVRNVLKDLLRRFGLRCVDTREIPRPATKGGAR